MKLSFSISMIMSALLFFSCFAEKNDNNGKREEQDADALKKWVQDKRIVTVKGIGGDLSVSGEVRVEGQGTNEKKEGHRQRGRGGATKRPFYTFDVEFNLMMDYRSERSWASVKLEFDNDMGTISGTVNKLALERAYLGGRIVPGETFIMDVELGRRFLSTVFDSKIEFASLFDGLLLKFNKSFENIGNFYVNGGPFIIDDRKYQFGYVAELGMLSLGNTGIYTKYSIIDWIRHSARERRELAFEFLDSQLIIGYQGEVPKWKRMLKVYLAGLYNHAARKIELTHFTRANWGCYAGFSIGQLRKKGDWALDTNYQIVAAQAVPDFDSAGIKRGNASEIGFYSFGKYGRGKPTTIKNAVGGGNFRGWVIEFLYGLTNNLTMLQNFQMSRTLDTDIGPMIKYYQYELEFIYAF